MVFRYFWNFKISNFVIESNVWHPFLILSQRAHHYWFPIIRFYNNCWNLRNRCYVLAYYPNWILICTYLFVCVGKQRMWSNIILTPLSSGDRRCNLINICSFCFCFPTYFSTYECIKCICTIQNNAAQERASDDTVCTYMQTTRHIKQFDWLHTNLFAIEFLFYVFFPFVEFIVALFSCFVRFGRVVAVDIYLRSFLDLVSLW